MHLPMNNLLLQEVSVKKGNALLTPSWSKRLIGRAFPCSKKSVLRKGMHLPILNNLLLQEVCVKKGNALPIE